MIYLCPNCGMLWSLFRTSKRYRITRNTPSRNCCKKAGE